GMNMILRNSQLQINNDQFNLLNTSNFGCPAYDANFNCIGVGQQNFKQNLQIVSGTNYVPRMSTGLELQVIMPIVNAPFRIYYAYNPLRMDTLVRPTSYITRDLFPAGAA